MELTLERCGSTNTELKRIVDSGRFLPSGSTLRAVAQTAGRGQRGNSWEAEPGKNLTFSILLRPGGLLPKHHFLISEAIAIATA
ncbi:MAG: biotin--[acetyl-CoA-carboxylase] ligase, partial [Muribaculaceae bacterium]|nr:biotin--[acetyl-CoA-carboxylase] ligase [Muribaculaceae bacterium]